VSAAHEPYAVVARAKGLSEAQIARRHLLRNSILPLVGVMSLDVGSVVGVSLAVDALFGTGGLAFVFLRALTVMLAALVAAFILVSDVLSAWLDPRSSVR